MAWLDEPNAGLPHGDSPRQCLEHIIDPAKVDAWLDAPNSAFGGKTPREISEDWPEQLETMIWQIASGSCS